MKYNVIDISFPVLGGVDVVEVDRNRNLQALTRNLPGRRLPG